MTTTKSTRTPTKQPNSDEITKQRLQKEKRKCIGSQQSGHCRVAGDKETRRKPSCSSSGSATDQQGRAKPTRSSETVGMGSVNARQQLQTGKASRPASGLDVVGRGAKASQACSVGWDSSEVECGTRCGDSSSASTALRREGERLRSNFLKKRKWPKYQAMQQQRRRLPAHHYQKPIQQALEQNQVRYYLLSLLSIASC
jgi:hypothetical protein